MRINGLTRFPHPILSPETTDYVDGKFEVEIEVDEDTANNSLQLKCSVTISEKSIEEQCLDGSARIGIDLRCAETYRHSLHPLNVGDNTIAFEPGLLSGRVSIRPLIWTTMLVEGFYSQNFDAEYEDQAFDLNLGDLLAWDVEQTVSVGQKKLAPMDSIFELARNEEIEEGQIAVDIEGEKIQINASGSTYDHIHQQRQIGIGQAVVLNAVYLPAVIQVLVYLKESTGDYADREWYQVFTAKCDHHNLDLHSADVLGNAGQLFKNPYLKIMESFNHG
jgi:hypothetical protein